ncbi:MAG: Asp-tRNA(Asn)/Glu-tRNA(Gln) amidotransferase subunit GatB [Ottowia sp.]|nr:Asp-tRNA(Asn)/Glu-tRNA(Gln) amidotransferase subunit GatB [Ottowia sp.]
MHPSWEVVIGLETHAQLRTSSKLFSGSATRFGAQANTQASAIDLALPGVLPMLNRAAVEHAITLGLALNATVATHSVFARKNYFYPDLPKGYQISQFELPVVAGGQLIIQVEDKTDTYEKVVHLTRAHLEEDAGKSLHEDYHGMSGIDLNRAGTPLLEIVSEPEMTSAREAVAYAKTLHHLLMWLGICDGNMQEGSFRCDANVSVRPKEQQTLGTRCEIKNLNSFRFLEEAILYEIHRQITLIEDGGKVTQETRLYDPDRKETRSMRSKEDAHDYRYFPDPDLLPLVIDASWIERVRQQMPTLPNDLRTHFIDNFGLSIYDATLLTQSHTMAQYFEQTMAVTATDSAHTLLAKPTANWIIGELAAALRRDNLDFPQSPIRPTQLSTLIQRIVDNTLSNKTAKEVFTAMWHTTVDNQETVDQIIEKLGLQQISDITALDELITTVLANNPQSVAEFRAGKEKAFNALVGQVMKLSKGKANPQHIHDLLRKKLQP